MYNYELDTSLLPKVWLTWASTKNKLFNKRYWLNCQTGEKKDTPEEWMFYDDEANIRHYWNAPEGKISYTSQRCDRDKIWTYAGANIIYFYAKYHKDIEKLEVAAVTMDSTRNEEPHPWRYADGRYFIGKDKSVVDVNGNAVTEYQLYRYHTARSFKYALSTLLRLSYINIVTDEFKKFIGADSFCIGNGTSINIAHPWHIQRWYATVQRPRGKGKEQKLTDELTALPLSDCSNIGETYPASEFRTGIYGSTDKLKDIMFFERVNEEWSVLRMFSRGYDNNRTSEQYRIYISDGGKIRICSSAKGEWVASRQPYMQWNFSYKFVNKDDAKRKCARCKYILNAIPRGMHERDVAKFMITALRFPEIEQLIKMGYVDIANSIIGSSTVRADIKNLFGVYNEKETNLLKKIGMTKPQLDAFCELRDNREYGWYASDALKTMREEYGERFIHLDPTKFKSQLQGTIFMRRYFGTHTTNSLITTAHIDTQKFINNIMRLGAKSNRVYSLAADTARLYLRLRAGTEPTINWYFDSESDVVRAHDAITVIYNVQEDERRALYNMAEAERRKEEEKRRAKIDEKRKEYEFEDGDYIIRLPKSILEILEEGSKQRICIGGYTTRHANGETNLFFLRKKAEDDKPFYAIEMDTHKNIIQIHGYCNKWLGNDPDAIPTVIRWLRKHSIWCSPEKLTCTSTGYGGGGSRVEMPVVDGKKGV